MKLNWQLVRWGFVFLLVMGLGITASSPFFTKTSVSNLDLYDHYSISSERELGTNYRLKWSYQIYSDFLFISTEPFVTILILTQNNYQLLLANDSSVNISFKLESYQEESKGEFKIPSKDVWVIVYNNTNYSFIFEDIYADYSLTMNTNFYNLSIVISVIAIFVVSILLSFILPIAVIYISSRKQAELQEENQRKDEEARGITFSTNELQEKLDLLKSIRQYYDRLPTHILMHMLRFNSFKELLLWGETLPPELRFIFDQGEVIFLKDQTIKIEEKPISQLLIDNLSKDSKHLCSNCGKEISHKENKCSNCGEDVKCVVCKLQLELKDQKCKCPFCETAGHLIHFYLWVDGINKCPLCKGKLLTTDIILLKD